MSSWRCFIKLLVFQYIHQHHLNLWRPLLDIGLPPDFPSFMAFHPGSSCLRFFWYRRYNVCMVFIPAKFWLHFLLNFTPVLCPNSAFVTCSFKLSPRINHQFELISKSPAQSARYFRRKHYEHTYLTIQWVQLRGILKKLGILRNYRNVVWNKVDYRKLGILTSSWI